MATIVKPNTFSAGAVIVAAEHNANFNTIYDDYNTNITNVNISASAAIVDTKLAQLTTAAKVNLSALVITSQAAGDLIYASSATALTRLAAGSSGQRLQSAGTAAPTWVAAAENGYVVQMVNSSTTARTAGTAQIPYDATKPGSSEGFQVMTLSITPAATSNKLRIDCNGSAAGNLNDNVAMALYDSGNPATADAISATVGRVENVSSVNLNLVHFMTAATTAAKVFTMRIGAASAGTIQFNGISGSTDLFGGVGMATITITEIKSA
jgi:hypothetical protein